MGDPGLDPDLGKSATEDTLGTIRESEHGLETNELLDASTALHRHPQPQGPDPCNTLASWLPVPAPPILPLL